MYDDEFEDLIDEDEIDLLELVSADTNSANQYLVFIGSDDEVYAINVSKVKELLVYKDLQMVKNNESNSIIKATADIREEMTTIVNFDEWFGNKVLEDKEYELIILAGFGGHNIGIMIKSVEYIININASNMQDNSANNPKTNFIAKIKLNSQDRLCTIFDCDKMLLDIFDESSVSLCIDYINTDENINHEKYILFADDSRFIRKMVESVFIKLDIKYKIFDDGEQLFTELETMSPNDIGLIITDLEMPVLDGHSLIKKIKKLHQYKDIDIIVHTNMSNDIMEETLISLGASNVIGKIDMIKLSEGIKKYFK
jgi:two-component system chemotaxis response regulator CheV